MTDGTVQLAPDSTGKKVDTSELTVGANTVERQRVVLASDATAAGIADVTNAPPASTAYGLPVRTVGDTYVALNGVAMTSAATLGTFDTNGYASFMLQVAGAFSATYLLEGSNDNTNFTSLWYYVTSSAQPTAVQVNFSGTTLGYGPIKTRYIRFRVSSFSSNSSSAVTLVLRTVPCALDFTNVSAAITSTPNTFIQPGGTVSSALGTTAFIKSAATTNATSVKASAGNLFGLCLSNNSAAVKYIKFYNKASSPTVGTDTPVAVLSIPANGGNLTIDHVWAIPRFTTGIAYAITGAVTDADTTAVAVNDVSGWIVYA